MGAVFQLAKSEGEYHSALAEHRARTAALELQVNQLKNDLVERDSQMDDLKAVISDLIESANEHRSVSLRRESMQETLKHEINMIYKVIKDPSQTEADYENGLILLELEAYETKRSSARECIAELKESKKKLQESVAEQQGITSKLREFTAELQRTKIKLQQTTADLVEVTSELQECKALLIQSLAQQADMKMQLNDEHIELQRKNATISGVLR